MKKLILDRDVKIYAHLQENGNHYVIPPAAQPKSFVGNAFLWALDEGDLFTASNNRRLSGAAQSGRGRYLF